MLLIATFINETPTLLNWAWNYAAMLEVYLLRTTNVQKCRNPKNLTPRLQGGPKMAYFCTPYNFIIYWPIFNPFRGQNNEKICNNAITKDPIASQVCRYTTLWKVSTLKAIENETSVTTNFQSASPSSKADTLNIWCKTAGCDSYFRQWLRQ